MDLWRYSTDFFCSIQQFLEKVSSHVAMNAVTTKKHPVCIDGIEGHWWCQVGWSSMDFSRLSLGIFTNNGVSKEKSSGCLDIKSAYLFYISPNIRRVWDQMDWVGYSCVARRAWWLSLAKWCGRHWMVDLWGLLSSFTGGKALFPLEHPKMCI